MDTILPSSKRSSSKPLAIPTNGPSVAGVLSAVLSVGAVLWVIGGAAGAASAQPRQGPEAAARVTYSDLDLSGEDGARTLLARINVAAKTACGKTVHSPLFPRTVARHDACVADATRAAIDRVDSQMLADLHRTQAAGTLLAVR
jgi:UrcA family protein